MKHRRREEVRSIRVAAYRLGMMDDPLGGEEDVDGPEAASLRAHTALEQLISGRDALSLEQLRHLAITLESTAHLQELVNYDVVRFVSHR